MQVTNLMTPLRLFDDAAIEQEGFAITYSSGLAAVYAVRNVEMNETKRMAH